MVDINLVSSSFKQQLDDLHLRYSNSHSLTVHLLDQLIDLDVEDWKKSAAFLMRDELMKIDSSFLEILESSCSEKRV